MRPPVMGGDACGACGRSAVGQYGPVLVCHACGTTRFLGPVTPPVQRESPWDRGCRAFLWTSVAIACVYVAIKAAWVLAPLLWALFGSG